MTEKKIRELFKVWQHRLGLDLWEIDIKIEQPDPLSSMIQIRRSASYNRAVVSIPPWLLETPCVPPPEMLDYEITPMRIEACVVHELLHCVRHHSHAMVVDRLDGLLHRDVYTVVTGEWDSIQELEIENLAVALVKSWPS